MNKFRSRLLFALLILIIIVLIGLGLLLGQLFKSFYLQTFHERMEKEAHLVEIFVQEEGITNPYLQDKMESVSSTLSARTTIVSTDGSVLVDSNRIEDSSTLEDSKVLKKVLKEQLTKKKPFHKMNEEYNLYYYGAPLIIKDKLVGFVVLSTSVDSLNEVNQQIWGLLVGSLGVAMIVILLLGVRIMSQYTKPIESATNVAMELAKGNYKARTYEDNIDETGMLSQAINMLARNLQDMVSNQEMQQDRLRTLIENMGSGMILIDSRGYINLINRAFKEQFQIDPSEYLHQLYYNCFQHRELVSLVEEIFMTEIKVRKQLLLPIKIERKHFDVYGAPIIGFNDEWKGIVLVFHDITELKKLEQMRKDFVANVSHELKTPITSITGFSETLLEGAMEDPQLTEQFLGIILKESQRMQNLIQDLLDLSKVEQHGYVIHTTPVNIKQMLEEMVMILSPRAQEKGIALHLHKTSSEGILDGDSARLKQIFINLISNAINYTLTDGRVDIAIKEKRHHVQVQIKDTGIGIEEEEIPRIFERFYRVDKARSRNSGGTGLGLAIVKHLVEAHHGTIDVESEIEKGTTFTVTLPKSFQST
ncbi:two-component system histidine kinase PnpS [Priestia koreensis]|uniref:two-component system histidine kinase PnpS n=1 Tax=Priestia koreensis TaxID=284581 RepID=UPI001F587831|nr:ATP-binding protein [Priestia koreensis]MCM3002774.1 ATP-binding protein [Priestia koreensis]UNL84469.1 PAS domain-containing protein [Priestia koreensis]